MSKAEQKWDQRYLEKGDQLPQVPESLMEHYTDLKPGRVLDLAAGDGAVSLFLADKGFRLAAVDISSVGLQRLASHLGARGYHAELFQQDLESVDCSLEELGLFDSIVILRYKPADRLWPQLIKALRPGGRLLITTFNLAHHRRTGFSKRFCLQPNELLARFTGLRLCCLESDTHQSGMDLYLFEKRDES
ncbi:class I SAM-dependent methyltransferase [Neptuniibacter halophilus]|uniref:class I SAM-dependent methyltransferase n=1 Tax=Neptuniibacter halophilus TaxID=651666 RepID=UPI0025731CA2|nr:class I SAM-dependent methyltransferase [Neptuniibacter halophilus]